MGVTAMAVKVRVQPMRRAAETAVADAAIFPQVAVRLAPELPDLSGPQSLRRTNPIDTAPTAAVPIMVE